jgi:hypothetical protein
MCTTKHFTNGMHRSKNVQNVQNVQKVQSKSFARFTNTKNEKLPQRYWLVQSRT